MSRQYTGKEHTGIRTETLPNGLEEYVFERVTRYDRVTKKTITLSSKLLGIRTIGESEIRKTRPKKSAKAKSGQENSETCLQQSIPSVSRIRVGMSEILDWVGRESQIDAHLEKAFSEGDAAKLMSIARYWVGTSGQPLPRMEAWQHVHSIPYTWGMSEDVYHQLFSDVGLDEAGMQHYFRQRAGMISSDALVAVDSTTISTYSTQIPEARYGYNKDNDGLKTVKLVTLYSLHDHEPIAFAKQPSHMPDVVAIRNTIKQLQAIIESNCRPTIISDNGYYSEKNIYEYIANGMKFLVLGSPNVTWIRECIDRAKPKMKSLSTVCPFDPRIAGVTEMLMHSFKILRKKTSKAGQSGEMKEEIHRLYAHVYHHISAESDKVTAFRQNLMELRQAVLDEEPLSDAALKRVERYLMQSCKGRGGQLKVDFNDEAVEKTLQALGCFVLISNQNIDTFDALEAYRLREKIEELFAAQKGRTDGKRCRVWDSNRLQGRLFAQFVALGYHCYLEKKIKDVRKRLCVDKTITEAEQKKEKALAKWLDERSLIQILEWFDCVAEVKVDGTTWRTEISTKETLFLEMLGVIKGPRNPTAS